MSFSILNTTNGIYCAGCNSSGQLGLGDQDNRNILTKLTFFDNYEIISVHPSPFCTIINTTNGLYVFGSNRGGLGLDAPLNFDSEKYINIPTKLTFFDKYEIFSINSGIFYTMVYTNDGLYVFSSCSFHQLNNILFECPTIPTKINIEHEIISVHCGGVHTILNTVNGLYCTGANYHGQLGLGDTTARKSFTRLYFESSALEIISIHCGTEHTIIHTIDGLYVFGRNDCGQLGLGDNCGRKNPTKLNFEKEIISIHCNGFQNTVIHTVDGLYVFGHNRYGVLGLGHENDVFIPTKLNFNFEILFVEIKSLSMFINTEEGIYVCGANICGELGLGHFKNVTVPTKLNFDHKIVPNYENKNKIKSAQSFCE